MRRWKNFLAQEDGAVTVDWVVLTATLVMLGLAVQVSMGAASKGVADKISGKVQSMDVWTY